MWLQELEGIKITSAWIDETTIVIYLDNDKIVRLAAMDYNGQARLMPIANMTVQTKNRTGDNHD